MRAVVVMVIKPQKRGVVNEFELIVLMPESTYQFKTKSNIAIIASGKTLILLFM